MNSITYEPTTESPPDILKAAIDLQKTIVNNGGSIRVRVLPETLALTLIEEFSKSGATIQDKDVPYLEEFVDSLKTITVKEIEAFINIIKSRSKIGPAYDISEQAGGGIFNLRTFIKFSIITFVMAMPSLAETNFQDQSNDILLKAQKFELQKNIDDHRDKLNENKLDREIKRDNNYHNKNVDKLQREKMKLDLSTDKCGKADMLDGFTGWIAQTTCGIQIATDNLGDLFETMYNAMWEKGKNLFVFMMSMYVFSAALVGVLPSAGRAANALSGLVGSSLDLFVSKMITPLNTNIRHRTLDSESINRFEKICLEIKEKGMLDLLKKKNIVFDELARIRKSQGQTIDVNDRLEIETFFGGLNRELLQTVGLPGNNSTPSSLAANSKDALSERVLHMQRDNDVNRDTKIPKIMQDNMIADIIKHGVRLVDLQAESMIRVHPEIGQYYRPQSPQYQLEPAFTPYTEGKRGIIASKAPLHLANQDRWSHLSGGKAIKTHGKGHMTRGKRIKRRGKGNKTRGKVSKTRGKVSKTRGKKRKVSKTRVKVKVIKTNGKVRKSRANSKF
jgi:hypothetical protein